MTQQNAEILDAEIVADVKPLNNSGELAVASQPAPIAIDPYLKSKANACLELLRQFYPERFDSGSQRIVEMVRQGEASMLDNLHYTLVQKQQEIYLGIDNSSTISHTTTNHVQHTTNEGDTITYVQPVYHITYAPVTEYYDYTDNSYYYQDNSYTCSGCGGGGGVAIYNDNQNYNTGGGGGSRRDEIYVHEPPWGIVLWGFAVLLLFITCGAILHVSQMRPIPSGTGISNVR